MLRRSSNTGSRLPILDRPHFLTDLTFALLDLVFLSVPFSLADPNRSYTPVTYSESITLDFECCALAKEPLKKASSP